MSIFTFQSGECGFGYFKSIIFVTILVMLAFIPNAAVLLSWISSGGLGLMFAPLVYSNNYIIPAWLLGAFSLFPGLLAAYCQKNATRVVMFNIWVVSLILFAIAISSAGIYLAHFIAKDKEIYYECVEGAIKSLMKKAGMKGPKKGSTLERAGERFVEYKKAMSEYETYKMVPYPLSAFIFLHWQVGVTAIAFAAFPCAFSLWAVYHAWGNRNFFATDPVAYKNQRIADGPLFSDELSDDEFSSDSESSYLSETEPLSRNHTDMTLITDFQPDINSKPGKVITRKVV